ncbi:hypothetical protein HUO09_05010 [Vibrio sp. Y2-5]|uniref:hypothetical protein n=1 Tax=Vibrio sp. Y2-5 TaxID=2743977 RepID=UPI0016602C19|nr:hypothetical protein [Vibrio sp. Y2-5]MBD0785689.1 hypothetical protein [Vibrio sp. Y2-5]
MFQIVGGCLCSESLMIHPTDDKYSFVASLDYCNATVYTWMEHDFTVEHFHHSVVVNDEDNVVYQKLQFGQSLTFTFETNLDFLTFCSFVGLDLLPKSIEEA